MKVHKLGYYVRVAYIGTFNRYTMYDALCGIDGAIEGANTWAKVLKSGRACKKCLARRKRGKNATK